MAVISLIFKFLIIMKKIRLNVADLDATEVLSRDQLKSIFGGSSSGSDSDSISSCATNTCSPTGVECCYPQYNWCDNGYCKSRH
jgi:hypothetical protein